MTSKAKAKPLVGGSVRGKQAKRGLLKGGTYVFTSAQNNTHVHKPFWDALLGYCKARNAQLIVGGITYNKSAWSSKITRETDGIWYDPAVVPYMVNAPKKLVNTKVQWSGQLDILPTAANPTSGLMNFNAGKSHIIPHPTVRQASIPTQKGGIPQFVMTTGSCTVKNYIQRKAGQKAEFHHTYAAVVVEVERGNIWMRHIISGDDGSFIDYGHQYYPSGDVAWGDTAAISAEIHVEKANPKHVATLMNTVTYLNPKHLIWHDLIDFTVRNHHNRDDGDFRFAQWSADDERVDDMFTQAACLLDRTAELFDGTQYIARANHDMALERWLNEANFRSDPVNAITFLRLKLRQLTLISEGVKSPNMLGYELADRVQFDTAQRLVPLGLDDSLMVDRVELGVHGHIGINGRPASPTGMSGIGSKITYGHTHTAGRQFGVCTIGILAHTDMGYNHGYTTWSPTICAQYADGKRQLLTFTAGRATRDR